MAELINCKKCRRLFSSEHGEEYCTNCLPKDDRELRLAEEYLDENPDANVSQISEKTGVSEERILRLIRLGRLVLEDGVAYDNDCLNCGKPIVSGRYCVSCAKKMTGNLKEVFSTLDVDLKRDTKLGSGFHSSSRKK